MMESACELIDFSLERVKVAAIPHAGVEFTPGFIVYSPRMQYVCDLVNKFATRESGIVIYGETGTGKELVARSIHKKSFRSPKQFLAVNCAAFTPELIEAELFGHEQGAFTGAISMRRGLFEEADGGTFFLDEISELSLPMQAKLLRAIEERSARRIGSNREYKVNIRIVAATNKNLKKLVAERKFREDLYYRLDVLNIFLPPLRERPEDVPILAAHFIKKYGSQERPQRLSEPALDVLTSYKWPGNVRELKNAIERACALTSDEVIAADQFASQALGTGEGEDNAIPEFIDAHSRSLPTLEEVEKRMIHLAYIRNRGNVTKAARELGMHRTSLYHWLKKYGIEY